MGFPKEACSYTLECETNKVTQVHLLSMTCQDPLHIMFACGMLKNNACNVSW